jgi:hypothetical protein
VLVGLLAVAAVPGAIAATHYLDVDLLKAAYAIPVAVVLGLLAVRLARRAQRLTERTIGRIGGAGATRAGRWLGGLGVYLGLTAALAVGVYELLTYLSE